MILRERERAQMVSYRTQPSYMASERCYQTNYGVGREFPHIYICWPPFILAFFVFNQSSLKHPSGTLLCVLRGENPLCSSLDERTPFSPPRCEEYCVPQGRVEKGFLTHWETLSGLFYYTPFFLFLGQYLPRLYCLHTLTPRPVDYKTVNTSGDKECNPCILLALTYLVVRAY